jgi:hypothetical protein
VITGIPQYQSPAEQSMRCPCGLRYLVLMRDGFGHVEARVKARAKMIKARFIDARSVPFIQCECGEVLTFIDEVTNIVM